jgi:putative hydrolase of the HAD superfamily
MHLLLDVDGVLQFERHDLVSNLVNEFGWEGDHTAFRKVVFSDHQFSDALCGRCDFLDVLGRLLAADACVTSQQYLESWMSDFALNYDLLKSLDVLQCEGVYLASNQEQRRGGEVARAYEQYSFITGKYFSHELGFRKPERGFFAHIVRDLRIAASELVLVDDLAENLEAAETLGLRTVLYESNRQLCADLNRLGFLKSANK